jgi:hypothetical protein
MKKPKYWCYGDYSNKNYGINSLAFEDGNGNEYYYSYDTLVAFKVKGEKFVIKNYWGTTTGKHLNIIDGGDHKNRLSQEDFDKKYKEIFGDEK